MKDSKYVSKYNIYLCVKNTRNRSFQIPPIQNILYISFGYCQSIDDLFHFYEKSLHFIRILSQTNHKESVYKVNSHATRLRRIAKASVVEERDSNSEDTRDSLSANNRYVDRTPLCT